MRLKRIQIGEAERLDAHHKAILNFIKNNPGQTENQIVKAMEVKGICSKMTTLKKIDELIVMKEIKDLSKKGENRFHKFILNDENEFNLIDDWLSKLECTGEIIGHTIEKARELERRYKDIQDLPAELIVLDSDLSYAYAGSIKQMVEILLIESNRRIQSWKDRQILYSRIIKLLMKMIPYVYLRGINSFADRNPDSPLHMLNQDLHKGKRKFSKMKKDPITYAMEEGIMKDNMLDELRSIFINFQKEFLPVSLT
jgi:hypothetical protein